MVVGVDVISCTVKELYDANKNEELNINPLYQRDFVWKIEQKRALIETSINNMPHIQQMQMNCITKEKKYNCIDGKQRITTFTQFMDNEFGYNDGKDNIYYDNVPDDKDGRKMTSNERKIFESKTISIIVYSDLYYDEEVTKYQLHYFGVSATDDEKIISYIKSKSNTQLVKTIVSENNNVLAKHLTNKVRDGPILFILQLVKLMIDNKEELFLPIGKGLETYISGCSNKQMTECLKNINTRLKNIQKYVINPQVTNYNFMMLLYFLTKHDKKYDCNQKFMEKFSNEYYKKINKSKLKGHSIETLLESYEHAQSAIKSMGKKYKAKIIDSESESEPKSDEEIILIKTKTKSKSKTKTKSYTK